jgi:molecular chaperone DnaK
MEADDAAAIRSATEELQNASHKLAEAMYKNASGGPEGAAGGAGPDPHAGGQQGAKRPEDDVVDADFEEVKDDKKK